MVCFSLFVRLNASNNNIYNINNAKIQSTTTRKALAPFSLFYMSPIIITIVKRESGKRGQ